MFSSSYYDKLDPTYREALLKLESDLFNTKNNFDEDLQIIQDFASSYLTPRTAWLKIWKYQHRSTILPSVIYHFAYSENMKHEFCSRMVLPTRKLMNKDIEFEIHSGRSWRDANFDGLSLPHNMMDLALDYYENFARSHLPQKILKRYVQMRKLYEKIKAVEEENEEEWINAMKEADDNEFVKHNIEFKLGQDLTNKKLWILYIEYLKEYDVQELLQVYSKYCRFFVDDIAMKEEYKKAAEKYGKPTVPWKNAFEYEIYDPSLLKFELIPRSFEEQQKARCRVFFNDQNPLTQRFPFRATLMDYILKNAEANSSILQKLYFSCKYFYHKYRIPVCYHLFILYADGAPSYRFDDEALSIYPNTLEDIRLNSFCISTVLYYDVPEVPLSSLIPKLNRCVAKYISIVNQKLTFDELKFFIGHGSVVHFILLGVVITDASGKQVPFEDILALTPKLRTLVVDDVHCSTNFAQKLCEIPFENKFIRFSVKNRTNITVNPYCLGEFINKNALPYGRFYFNGNGNNFEAIVNTAINDFWKADPKPCFKLS